MLLFFLIINLHDKKVTVLVQATLFLADSEFSVGFPCHGLANPTFKLTNLTKVIGNWNKIGDRVNP